MSPVTWMTIDKMHMFQSETSSVSPKMLKVNVKRFHHYYYCHSPLIITLVKLFKLPEVFDAWSYRWMTCVRFTNYLVQCIDQCIWPKPKLTLLCLSFIKCKDFCDFWCVVSSIFRLMFFFHISYYWSHFYCDEDIFNNHLWHISRVWGLSPLTLTSRAQSSSPLPNCIILSIMFMNLLWEVYIGPAWQWEFDLKFSMSSYSDEVQTCDQ